MFNTQQEICDNFLFATIFYDKTGNNSITHILCPDLNALSDYLINQMDLEVFDEFATKKEKKTQSKINILVVFCLTQNQRRQIIEWISMRWSIPNLAEILGIPTDEIGDGVNRKTVDFNGLSFEKLQSIAYRAGINVYGKTKEELIDCLSS